MFAKLTKLTILLVLVSFTLSVEQNEFLEQTNQTQENSHEIDIQLRFLENEKSISQEDINEVLNRKKQQSNQSIQQMYDSLNARSDAYNPNSPRFNPTTLNNKGGKAAQNSHKNASEMWKYIRENNSAAPPANKK